MNLHLPAQLTAEDYGNAQILHVGKRRQLVLFLVLSIIFLCAVFFFTVDLTPGLGVYLIVLFAATVVVAISWWSAYVRLPSRLRKRAAKLFQQQKSLQIARELDLTDEFLESHSERGNLKQPWNEFHKWKADEKVIIVYSSDLLLTMFPRRWFASEADYQSLKDVLQHQIGESGKPRKRD